MAEKQAWTRLYRCGASVVGVNPPPACPTHGDGGCPPKPGVHPMSHLDVEKGTGPHVWVQWKGTDVCADIHCACGAHLHWDGDFMYFVKCPDCQRIWEVGTHVRLYEVWPDEERPAMVEPKGESDARERGVMYLEQQVAALTAERDEARAERNAAQESRQRLQSALFDIAVALNELSPNDDARLAMRLKELLPPR